LPPTFLLGGRYRNGEGVYTENPLFTMMKQDSLLNEIQLALQRQYITPSITPFRTIEGQKVCEKNS